MNISKIFLILIGIVFFEALLVNAELEAKLDLSFFMGTRFEDEPKPLKLNRVLPALYFDQRLDHFDESNLKTWKQRYWVETQYFSRTDGIVLLYIGGESEASPRSIMSGLFEDICKSTKCLKVLLEHRYYGQSRPTSDLSPNSLKYLKAKQAIEDLADFRRFIHGSFNLKSNKWITFGGSYPGSLSALFRAKYPDLVHASFASSAPMFFTTDFVGYSEVLARSIDLYNRACTLEIANAYKIIDNLLKTASGRQIVQKTFTTCTSLENYMDILTFYFTMFNYVAGELQYNPSKRGLCDIMLDTRLGDSMMRYATYVKKKANPYCVYTSYWSYVSYFQDTKWETYSSGSKQWFYQTCADFGHFMTANSTKQPFGYSLDQKFFKKLCYDVFGINFTPNQIEENVKQANLYYGGRDFNGTRVYFTNGELDPWSASGFYYPKDGSQIETVIIRGATHCQDMSYGVSQDIIRAQIRAKDFIINKWLIQN